MKPYTFVNYDYLNSAYLQEMGRMLSMEQQRRAEEEKMMIDRMQRQDDSMKRRQEENNLFMQVT